MSDYPFVTTASPLKQTNKAPVSRFDMADNHVPYEYLQHIPDFEQVHLNCLSDEHSDIYESAEVRELVDDYVTCRADQYVSTCELLNHLSECIQSLSNNKHKKLLVFIDHHTTWPKHHPNPHFDSEPDVIGIFDTKLAEYGEFSGPCKVAEWADIETLGELKTPKDKHAGPAQLGIYLALANQARPDRVGMYGFTCSSDGYQLQYSDPSGLYTSRGFAWNDLSALAGYVNTLYNPKNDRSNRDESITRSSERDLLGRPTWNITFQGIVYSNCHVKVVGRPWTRMSWVAETPGKNPTVFKDAYWSTGRTFKEGELYDILQDDTGITPGFVQVAIHGDVPDANGDGIVRTFDGYTLRLKTRIVMSTSGDPLTKCDSVRSFLKMMYDILEAHRWAVGQRKILHRDISPANIIINPRDANGFGKLDEPGRPRFITEVLTGEHHALPLAALCDLDNGAEEDRTDPRSPTFKKAIENGDADDHLRDRTGTPRYMARAVCRGKAMRVGRGDFVAMASLSETALQLYHRTYSPDALRDFEEQGRETHGAVFDTKTMHHKQTFQHKARHDAESVFWVIVGFLLRANPLGDTVDEHWEDLDGAWEHFSSHCIRGNGKSHDSRLAFFEEAEWWESVLHHKLAFVAPLLAQLGDQVLPEYDLLNPRPNSLHLHEAMQRILLNHIVAITEESDVRLDTERLRTIRERPVPPPRESTCPSVDGQHLPFSRGSKRKSEGTDSKRKRAKSMGPPAQDLTSFPGAHTDLSLSNDLVTPHALDAL